MASPGPPPPETKLIATGWLKAAGVIFVLTAGLAVTFDRDPATGQDSFARFLIVTGIGGLLSTGALHMAFRPLAAARAAQPLPSDPSGALSSRPHLLTVAALGFSLLCLGGGLLMLALG